MQAMCIPKKNLCRSYDAVGMLHGTIEAFA